MPTPVIRFLALILLTTACMAGAQVAIPTFGARGDLPPALAVTFSSQLRRAVEGAGLAVTEGELITAGIAGSLDSEYAKLIAELDDVRYAVSGEIAAAPEGAGTAQAPFVVNLIVVDAEQDRSTDLISRPLTVERLRDVTRDLAAIIREFTEQGASLPEGDAGLYVTTEPGEAEVFLDGVRLGLSSRLDVRMLAPGRYELEVRKEGFLPESRTVELRSGNVQFVPLVLTAVTGGGILVTSSPTAEVYLDGEWMGATPLTLEARPGVRVLTLEREGFRPEQVAVSVRNYRVNRLDLQLQPDREPLLFWPVRREYTVYVNGELQPGSYARDVRPGRVSIELRRGAEVRSFDVFLPLRGAFELDFETGRLVQRGR